jgi:hypothetical protein
MKGLLRNRLKTKHTRDRLLIESVGFAMDLKNHQMDILIVLIEFKDERGAIYLF